MALTDKKAIRSALYAAIEYEKSFIDSYRDSITRQIPENEEAVIVARGRIRAWKRVLERYFVPRKDPIEEGLENGTIKTINIYDLMKGKIDDRD
ncbi:hypothetical protein PP938_gp030 [Rhizobium phage AF3]|uniref:Uncharacterized protein n=1 Tax=Rhizobium phage AF3 TaxID=2763529 RepID=A0A7G7WWD2_9CAUD|nr:hypothetical protein PP938_gp030 [Rhizobium phage AF3]QNH71526.1 hypothetical protein AF3_030 [Rhizobium phage AF3]